MSFEHAVSWMEHNELRTERDALRTECQDVWKKYNMLLGEHVQLNTRYEEIVRKHGILRTEFVVLNTRYEELRARLEAYGAKDLNAFLKAYDELRTLYDVLCDSYDELRTKHEKLLDERF